MNKIIFSIIFSIFLFAGTAIENYACSCVELSEIPINQQVKDAYVKSTAVFIGEVVEVIKNPEILSVTVRFRVEKSWNGKFQKEITISTPSDGAMCGYEFQVGKKYLVYASGESNNLSTYLCTRTASAASNKDIAVLNKIKKPQIKSSPK